MEKIKAFYKNFKIDILCLFVITVLFIVIALFLGHIYGDLYIDCGREAYLPELILKGKVLYKDIFGMYNPLSYQINAVAYLIFGSSWNTLYLLSYINAWLMLIGLYLISRNFINEYFSSAIIVVLMSLFIFGNIELVSYIYPYSFAFPYATTCYTFSLVFFIKYIKNKQQNDLFISALLMGLSLANRLEFALCILPMLVVMAHKNESVKNFLITIFMITIPTIISYGILFIQGLTFTDLLNYIKFIKDFWATPEQQHYTNNSVIVKWTLYNIKTCFKIFNEFVLFCIMGSIYLSMFKRNKYFLLTALALLPLYINLDMSFIREITNINIFAWVTIATITILYFKSNKIETQKDYIFIFLAITGLLSCSRVNFLPINGGYAIYFLIPIITLWIYFITAEFRILKNINYKVYVTITLIILSLTNIFYIKKITSNYVAVNTVKGSKFCTLEYAEVFNNTIEWINKNTKPNQSVLALPEGIMLNYITERPTKPMYYHLMPNHISALGENNIVEGINLDKPNYIVLNDLYYMMYDKSLMCKDYGLKICEYIKKNYILVNSIYPSTTTNGYFFSAQIYKAKE